MANDGDYAFLAPWCARHPDMLPVGLIALDASRRILEVTPLAASLCGVTSAELRGQRLDETPLSSITVRLEESAPGAALIRCGATVRGHAQELRCTCVPVEEGSDGGAVTIVMLEESESPAVADNARVQLEKLASIDNLVAGVAHELNNPLTAMLGYAELVLQRTEDERSRRRLSFIVDESRRCHRIVQNLLTFAERNKRERIPTDVNTLLNETLALCRYQMQVDEIALHIETDPRPAMVLADAPELQRAFLNLINNAHRALIDDHGHERALTVSTVADERKVTVTIQDTGVGIAPEIRQSVFDPFFTTRPLGEGMGLGLSVAFGIVQDHGGRIWLDTSPGEIGACFRLELPIAE